MSKGKGDNTPKPQNDVYAIEYDILLEDLINCFIYCLPDRCKQFAWEEHVFKITCVP